MMHKDVKRIIAETVGAIILLSLTCLTAKAQTHYSSQVSIGAKAGADFSRVFFNPGVKQSLLTGAVAGITVRYIEENHFGLIAELNFEQRGWKENFEGAPYNYSRTVNYMQIPFLAHIYFGRRGRFFFNAGPEIGFVIGSSVKSNFDPWHIDQLPDFPINHKNTKEMTMDVNQKIDFGISAGLGGEFFANPRHSLYLEGRFYYGLGNILKSGRQENFNASNSMSVMVTLGYWFRIK